MEKRKERGVGARMEAYGCRQGGQEKAPLRGQITGMSGVDHFIRKGLAHLKVGSGLISALGPSLLCSLT